MAAAHWNARRSASQMRPDPATLPLLEVHDLKVHFSLRGSFLQRMLGRDTGSVKAVDGVTFKLQRGEVLGLVGESGSGKTTLSRAVLSLVKVTGGSIAFNGETISGLSERQFRPLRKRLQLIFQDPHASLNPAMTILDAVGHPLRIHHIAKGDVEVRRLVSQSLERVGLVPVQRFLYKYPSDLSGGQKQRAVLARAIILGPELVIADEPVSMLDMSVRAKMLELMGDLKRDLGLTYLYVTHDLATARYLLRPHRDHVPRANSRDRLGGRDLRQTAPSLHEGAARGYPRARPEPQGAAPTSPGARCPTPWSLRSAVRSTRAARGPSGHAAGRAATCTRCSRRGGQRSSPDEYLREVRDRRRSRRTRLAVD